MSAGELSAAQLADLGNRLETLKSELEAQIERAGDSARRVELDQQSIGRVSRIDAIQQQQMAIASLAQAEQQFKAIEKALARIADGDYGYCAQCGEPIAFQRLQVQPTANLCIDCQSANEKR